MPHATSADARSGYVAANRMVSGPPSEIPTNAARSQPAASILTVVERKDVNKIDDDTLVRVDMSRKAMTQIRETVLALLVGHDMEARAADKLARTLSEGRWTHDYPITADMAKDFGLFVSTALPDGVRDIIRLYPQPRGAGQTCACGAKRPGVAGWSERFCQPRPVSVLHASGSCVRCRGSNRTVPRSTVAAA